MDALKHDENGLIAHYQHADRLMAGVLGVHLVYS